MKLSIPVLKKLTVATLLSLSLGFGVSATPQGKGQKSGKSSKGNPAKQLPPTTTDIPDGSVDANVPNGPTTSKKTTVSKKPVSKKTTVYKKSPVSKKSRTSTVPIVSGGGGGTHQSCVASCNTQHKNDAEICRGKTGQDRASCQQSINEQHRLCIQSCPK